MTAGHVQIEFEFKTDASFLFLQERRFLYRYFYLQDSSIYCKIQIEVMLCLCC